MQDLVPALKMSALAFPKVHSVWGRLWDDIGLSPAGQPRAALSTKRLKKLAEVSRSILYIVSKTSFAVSSIDLVVDAHICELSEFSCFFLGGGEGCCCLPGIVFDFPFFFFFCSGIWLCLKCVILFTKSVHS